MYQFASKKFNAPEWRLFEWHREFLIYLIAAIIILAGVSKASALTTSSIYVNPDGLIGYWDFAQCTGTSATDRGDWGVTGTLYGGANTTWIAGKYGCGVKLNGLNSAVDIGNNSILNPQSLTISAWVNVSVNLPNSNEWIVR